MEEHHSELHEQVIQHRFVWEFATDVDEIVAYSFAWKPGYSEPLTPEADLEVIGYVEQYLEHHGVVVNRVLSEGMYRSGGDERFAKDMGLEIE